MSSKRKSRVALASDSEGSDVSGDNNSTSTKKKIRVADQDDEDATSDSGDEWGSKGKQA